MLGRRRTGIARASPWLPNNGPFADDVIVAVSLLVEREDEESRDEGAKLKE